MKKSLLRVEALEDRSLPSAAFVLDWNDLIVDVQRLRNQGNQQAARALAMMGVAVYDSVNAINPTHEVYHVPATPPAGTSDDAAAAQAAHDVAYALYTQDAERARIDGLLDTQLAQLLREGETGIADGIALGQFVAGEVLAWRAHDHSGDTVPYTPGTGPGAWQPTPPNPPGTVPATPQWPYVTPFALRSGDQFRPGPPPELTSAEYTEAYREVKALGGIDSTTRTPEQTEIALYWANAGVGLWSQITHTVAAAHHLTLAENARLFAQVNVANADAFIASYDTKYAYNYWRPVTAIRAANSDGNPDTVADPTWKPLIVTPNHPSFASNHATQSRAAAEALAAFFGTDHVSFTATSAGMERSYQTFTEAAKEAGMSRIYAGIHWSFDMAAGEALGRKVGQYVADHYFQPLPVCGGRHKVTLAPARHAGGRLAPPVPAGSLSQPGLFLGPAMAPASNWNAPAGDHGPAERPAPADGDHTARSGTLIFAPGEKTKTTTIEVKGGSKEIDDPFSLDLFGLSSHALFTKGRGSGAT
jgi:hypothetical protein